MIEKYLSEKIKLLSLFSIILVLYIHSGFHNYPHEILGMELNNILQECISEKIGRCAVPLFYMISGFLFFQNINNGIKSIFVKMKKRIYTLLIPFIIACLFFPLFYYIIEYIPWANKFINGDGITNFFSQSIDIVILSIFYKTPDTSSPLAFQLWFLRDLIIIIAVSPLIYIIKKHINQYVFITILFIISNIPQIDNIFPVSALFWFVFGDIAIKRLNNRNTPYIIFIYLFICILEIVFNLEFPKYISIAVKVIGVIGIWGLYDFIIPKHFSLINNKFLSIACSSTFFIYLYHEPTINIVRKLLVVFFGKSSFGFAMSYLLSPWIFAVGAIIVTIILKKITPKTYSIITGGR